MTTTTAEVSTCDHVSWGGGGVTKRDRMTQVTLLLAFTPPSVDAMLAGLPLRWHTLSCDGALVSNHDI